MDYNGLWRRGPGANAKSCIVTVGRVASSRFSTAMTGRIEELAVVAERAASRRRRMGKQKGICAAVAASLARTQQPAVVSKPFGLSKRLC